MRAREIAETLLNGNISTAREEMGVHPDDVETVLRAFDVVEELVELTPRPDMGDAEYDRWVDCIGRVRRCLNGGT